MEVHLLAAAPPAPPATLREALDAAMHRVPILENAYFRSLADDSMSLSRFQETQVQFFHAVLFFPRAMAALSARLPDSAARMTLMQNLDEEHGEGDELAAHDQTFQQFLANLGVTDAELSVSREAAAVAAFNYALVGICSMADPDFAFASLGVIEHSFAQISMFLGETIVRRGWIPRTRLLHYAVHSELDKRHADEFFQELQPGWGKGGRPRQVIMTGLDTGLYIFDRLYRDLALGIAGSS